MPSQDVPGLTARLAELERTVFGDDAWSEDSLRGLVEDEDGTLVLVEPNSAGAADTMAYAAFRTVLDEAELLRVAVRPEARRRGLARRLLERGFETLAEGGVVTCHLEVRGDNVAAHRLYESLGFERVGHRPSYYSDGCDAALLSKALERRPSKNLRGD